MSPRWWFLSTAALATSLLATTASAQVIVQRPERYASPQRFALEFRVGPYAPEVDEEFPGKTLPPHRRFFGTGRRPMYQMELDYQFFRRFGTAAVGASVGYFRQSAHAPAEPMAPKNPQEPPPEVDWDNRTADKSTFSLYPMSLVAVYRADQLYRFFRVPLVPYAKAGLNYTIWSVYDGNDDVATAPGGRGRGGTLGWQAAVGMSLVLDFIDPGAARALDGETGVNHTHAFFELAKFEVSGLGQKDRLHVGDSTWLAGLMFEF